MLLKHSYGTIIFDIKRYKYKFKNEVQILLLKCHQCAVKLYVEDLIFL